MLFKHLFPLLWLAPSVLARGLDPVQICVAGCEETLAFVTFSDASTKYYQQYCRSKLRQTSVSLCSQLYCTKEEIEAGFLAVSSTCELYGPGPVPPYQPHPNLSQRDLEQMAEKDQKLLVDGSALNHTFIPVQSAFDLAYKTQYYWNAEVNRQAYYAWLLNVFWAAVIGVSILFQLLGYLAAKMQARSRPDVGNESQGMSPPPNSLEWLRYKINRYILIPATFGNRSVEPYGWFTVPPLLESLVIVAFISLNLIFCAVDYHLFPGNLSWPENSNQLWRYFSDRTGVFAFANLPLTWLFGTRNNFLLWVTNWSPSTFNNFHRWIGRVAALQAVLHSIGYTVLDFKSIGAEYYYAEWAEEWWYTGAIGTCAISIILGFAVYPLRKHMYDFFLVAHIVLALVVLVNCFYHVSIFLGEYNPWLWACVAIWAFDRFLRLVRLITCNLNFRKNSQRAVITYDQECDLISLDVATTPWVTKMPGSFYYIYVLHGLRFWESHPFTSSWAMSKIDSSSASPTGESFHTDEKMPNVTGDASTRSNSSSQMCVDESRVRFYIRPGSGFTSRLRKFLVNDQGTATKPLRVFIEGPYGERVPIHRFQNVLIVVGGSGITVALQHLQAMLRKRMSAGPSEATPASVRLIWAVRQVALIEKFSDEMKTYEDQLGLKIDIFATGNKAIVPENKADFPSQGDLMLAGWQVHRGRPDLREVVLREREDTVGSLAVVSCCPPSMADAARQHCVGVMKQTQRNIEYLQESFSW